MDISHRRPRPAPPRRLRAAVLLIASGLLQALAAAAGPPPTKTRPAPEEPTQAAEESEADTVTTAAAPSDPHTALAGRIESILRRPEFVGSSFGLLVSELDSGRVIYAHSPDTLLPPASTAKLVSCGGALEALGPDFRFETRLVRTGAVDDGVLDGDLVLIASGDPNLSQRILAPTTKTEKTSVAGNTREPPIERLLFVDKDHTYAGYSDASVVPGDPLVVLRRFAKAVAAAGIREIRGDIVVDDGLFKERFDEFVGEYSAVCINDNVVDIEVTPGAQVGDPVRLRIAPLLPSVEVKALARTVAADEGSDLWVERREGVASFALRGKLALGARPTLRVGRLRDPAMAAAHWLHDVLREQDVQLRGTRRVERFGPSIYRNFDVVARHRSAPLSEAVRVALKVSHNLHATMFPPLVGALRKGRGERVAGFELIREQYRAGGLPVRSIVLHSGSGGGRADRLSARFLVELLRHHSGLDSFPALWNALPVGGVDGTLASRFRDSKLRRRVRAKTGTLVYKGSFNDEWVYLSKSLAGYIDLRRSGGDPQKEGPDRDQILAFALTIANTVTSSRARGVEELFRAQEDLLEAIAEYRVRERRAAEKAASSAAKPAQNTRPGSRPTGG